MLVLLYQVFSSLLGHLHFSVHFSFTFVEQLFKNHPVSPPVSRLFLNCWEQSRHDMIWSCMTLWYQLLDYTFDHGKNHMSVSIRNYMSNTISQWHGKGGGCRGVVSLNFSLIWFVLAWGGIRIDFVSRLIERRQEWLPTFSLFYRCPLWEKKKERKKGGKKKGRKENEKRK